MYCADPESHMLTRTATMHISKAEYDLVHNAKDSIIQAFIIDNLSRVKAI